mmetsp:Transcript_9770/g.10859  ORF Transcript_9770/g.10859 Transcript_9770/m.10859 type:complete len:491 (+) Transcript_9770:51-1523(+)|eukprot:CAMPEP_0194148968 /NCGR_PEP_ID=MMETSP0152-20130528/35667_1 /TAXON_ID=1049557 /ORGANISM="Thalassiothrix antarctica, Strain L6-D1" /LENGTH=490 /DNA_ID=CAMNT_0038850867 /DNA_START=403 /DNA_END=1878 /DNA_ORIENTATION=+
MSVPQDEGRPDVHLSPRHETKDNDETNSSIKFPTHATFLVPSEIHPNMIDREEDTAQLRLLAGKLSADWRGEDFMAPALARRIRDFQFAQEKRRRKYGDERPWGILGLYDHLAAIRVDVEWAEDAAWRRANGDSYLSWVDFDASKKRGVNRPFFTYFLLCACTINIIISIAVNGWIVEPLSVNPMIGPSKETLILMGAKYSDLIVNYNEAWRLVTSIILHAGLVHYFINMLALWFVGTAIESTHGLLAAMILFVIPAIGGIILSAIFLPAYITVGASGGIFGLIGACLADIIMNWRLLFSDFVNESGKKHKHAMVIIFLLVDIILNSIIGLTPYVDNFTHLGGMAIGFLCGISTMERLPSDFFGIQQDWVTKTKQIVIRFFGLIVSIIGILIATIILLEGDGETTPCPSCSWLSCVPFPPWNDYSERWWYCDDCGNVSAEIVLEPNLHLDLECPDGRSVDVDLNSKMKVDRVELERKLPKYCRDFCQEVN